MNKRFLAASIGLGLFVGAVCAQTFDMPKRKSGQWEVKMESAMMHGMVTTMEQCIDEKTDAEMQKNSMQGQGKSDCKLVSSKKTANGWEADTVCKQEKTTITGHSVMSGDFQSAYQMDSTTSFDPPMQGMKEIKSTMKVRYLGACKADMKPGDATVNGVKIGQGGAAGGQAPKMSQEDMKKMMEAMQKMKPQ
jgi:hypothetical protein